MTNLLSSLLLPHTELASTILLIIKIVLLDDGYAALAQSALAPVLLPPSDIGIMRNSIMAGFVDLLQALPTAGC
jgi:predicted membrane-bound spermidine synthase